jgi:hypothetical protein
MFATNSELLHCVCHGSLGVYIGCERIASTTDDFSYNVPIMHCQIIVRHTSK